MLQLSEFVWTLRSSVLVVFNSFLLIVTTDRSNLSSDEKRFFFAVNLYIFTFLGTLPLIIIILFIKNAEACLAHGADVKELLEEPLKVLNKKERKRK